MNKTFKALLYVLIFSLSAVSCTSKLMFFNGAENYETNIPVSSSEELLSNYKDNIEVDSSPVEISPLKNETDGLTYILEPYMDYSSHLFIGNEGKDFLENSIIYNLSPDSPISSETWAKTVQIIFSFGEEDKPLIKMYITDFVSEDNIERQYAVSGLMKLLSLRYPISLGGDMEAVKKSEIISDLNDVDDRYNYLIRQAFCLGFTDYTVDKSQIFRPYESLTTAEAISILYRTLSNLGLPVTSNDKSIEDDKASDVSEIPEDNSSNSFSVESILLEYNSYKASLQQSNNTRNNKKIEMLNLAEAIIGITHDDFSNLDKPLAIETWAKILNQVFGLGAEDIDPYISFEKDNTLSYDIAAVSILKSSEKLIGEATRDATEDELKAAREAIPQFDTARDISKFALMYSSGLLEGLVQIPGFTPQRPINEKEALLLIKRVIELYSFK